MSPQELYTLLKDKGFKGIQPGQDVLACRLYSLYELTQKEGIIAMSQDGKVDDPPLIQEFLPLFGFHSEEASDKRLTLLEKKIRWAETPEQDELLAACVLVLIEEGANQNYTTLKMGFLPRIKAMIGEILNLMSFAYKGLEEEQRKFILSLKTREGVERLLATHGPGGSLAFLMEMRRRFEEIRDLFCSLFDQMIDAGVDVPEELKNLMRQDIRSQRAGKD